MLLAVVGRAEVIDRIAITVGPRAITESDILREIRLAAFFNQAEPDFLPPGRRLAAGQYEFPEASEVAPALAALKKGRFPIEAARLSEGDVQRGLLQQLALERFIDERFGPAVQISDDEMREYYSKRWVPNWENKEKGAAAPFEEVRSEIGRILRAQRADELLNTWLKETRGRIRIEFKDEALQ
jgi:hypothetical protein